MSEDERLYAAVAAGVVGADEAHRALLQSIVEVAMAIFEARASSIFLFDARSDELVFEAVAGEGAASLVGRRYPSGTGIAGWVLATLQPVVIEDVGRDERFAREVAESTGYVPQGLMAVPLVHGERTLGVLEVLDRPQAKMFTLGEMGLLSLFASQAAISLDLLQRARHARSILVDHEGDAAVLARLGAVLAGLDDRGHESGIQLLRLLEDVLRGRGSQREGDGG